MADSGSEPLRDSLTSPLDARSGEPIGPFVLASLSTILLWTACVVVTGPLGPTPAQLAAYRAECVQLWTDEDLHQPLDETWVAGCIDARRHGETPDDIRARLRATDEWQARHQPPPPHPTAGEAGPLHLQGADFYTADGRVWQARGVTAFLLFERYQRGEDIEPQLRWYVAHGRNLVRVFVGGVSWTAPWCQDCTAGTAHPDLAQLPAFFDLCADWGLRVEATVITEDRPIAEWRRVLDTVYTAASGRWNVFVEVSNEPWTHGPDPRAVVAGLDRHGVLSAFGIQPEPAAEGWKPVEHLDYVTFHSSRDLRYVPHNGKDAKDIRDVCRCPVFDDEPMGYADFDRSGGGARTTNGDIMAAHFATCGLFAAGCTWHLNSGVYGQVPAPKSHEEAISARLQAIADFLPSAAHTWTYARAGLGDFALTYAQGDSLVNHAYGMWSGGVQYVVVPLPRPGWQPMPVNGWHLDHIGPEIGLMSLWR